MGKISGFFNDDVAGAMSTASSEGSSGSKRIKNPGFYVVKNLSSKYKNKDGEIVEYPNITVSEKKGSLLLNLMFEVVDGGTENVPTGSYGYGMIVLAPKPGSPKKKVQDTMNLTKPRLAALLGDEKMKEFTYDEEWVEENFISKFKKDGDGYKVSSECSMTETVVVEYTVGEWNGKLKLDLASISKFKDGDVSRETGGSIDDVVSSPISEDASSSDLEAINNLSGDFDAF
jgi:hypothetical protein